MFNFASKKHGCSELLSNLGHAIEIYLVGSFRFKLSFHVRKIELGTWKFCLKGSLIVLNGSLLCCAKQTDVLSLATNPDPCKEPVPDLDYTSESSRVVGFGT